MKELRETKVMLDLNPEHGVEISIREDGKQVWVNVDGLCRMRLTAVPGTSFSLTVEDRRPRREFPHEEESGD